MKPAPSAAGTVRLALSYIDPGTWTGGYNYLLNMVRVLSDYAPDRIRPVLFALADVPEHDLEPYTRVKALQLVRLDPGEAVQSLPRLARSVLLGTDVVAARTFMASGIDVVFEVARFYGRKFPIPCVAWMADFQHRLMPDMFGRLSYWKRELGFQMQIAAGRTILLSSRSAREDFERFYKGLPENVDVIPFAVTPDTGAVAEEPARIRARYELPDRFFYLPNQFWRHKNHRLVIDALAVLRNRGVDVVVAASGSTSDPRAPELYSSLKAQVTSLGLDANFRFLGMIPRTDVGGLMAACTAVLNPSLHEGWSTPVEEAKASGVRLILSDIAVHREQKSADTLLFDPRSPESLADALGKISAIDENDDARALRRAVAREKYEDNRRNYAERLAVLMERVAARGHAGHVGQRT